MRKRQTKNSMQRILIICVTILSFGTAVKAQSIDIDLLRRINLGRSQSLDNSFLAITNSAEPVALAVPVGLFVAGWIKKDSSLKCNAIQIVGALAVSTALTEGLKYVIKRPRPYVTYPDIQHKAAEGSPSFPSGHSAVAFTIATSLSLNYPKWYVIAPSYLWAATVAYSRMDLGVHYPSDVLVGMLIGAGSSYLCYKGQQWLDRKRGKSVISGL